MCIAEKAANSVVLVSHPTPQSQLFCGYVSRELDCPVELTAAGSSLEGVARQGGAILLDVDQLREEELFAWKEVATEPGAASLAAMNLRDEDHAMQVISRYALQGGFYRQDSPDTICEGIKHLLQGELWMSRSLMSRLIVSYRGLQKKTVPLQNGLSFRELDVIGLVALGASNTEIAEKLFISEHTVKTHVYNIFRKINVRNRLQAAAWARNNLPTVDVVGGRLAPAVGETGAQG
jgi:LuxR family transcriptional regulator, positive regulator of biofilm formation